MLAVRWGVLSLLTLLASLTSEQPRQKHGQVGEGSLVTGLTPAKPSWHQTTLYLFCSLNACTLLSRFSHVGLFASPRTMPVRLLCPWDFSGSNAGVGCRFLLQEIFPTEESNFHLSPLLHWQVDSLPFMPPKKPSILIPELRPISGHTWERVLAL